jgi:hypothetical protein
MVIRAAQFAGGHVAVHKIGTVSKDNFVFASRSNMRNARVVKASTTGKRNHKNELGKGRCMSRLTPI